MMQPDEGRYFVITRSPFAREIQPERYLGYFKYREHAEYRARTKAGDWGDPVSIRKETPREAAFYKAKRIWIRSLRVFFGVLIGLLTYAFLISGHNGMGDVPFSQMTLNLVLGNLIRVAFAMGLFWLSWVLAFGPGPQDPK